MADIGGGEGLFLSSLLRQHPGMRGILFDRQGTAPSCRLAVRTLMRRYCLLTLCHSSMR